MSDTSEIDLIRQFVRRNALGPRFREIFAEEDLVVGIFGSRHGEDVRLAVIWEGDATPESLAEALLAKARAV